MSRSEKRPILLEWLFWFITSEHIHEFWARYTLEFVTAKIRALES